MYASTKQKALHGFSLIELLIVIGIVAVISTISLVSIVGWRGKKELGATSQQIATLVREAESRAMAQVEGASWGVRFENSATEKPFYALFYSDTYSTSTVVNRYPLPANLAYDVTGLQSGEAMEVVFDQISGRPKYRKVIGAAPQGWASGTNVSLTILPSGSSPTNSVTVSIDPSGTVSFDTFSCVITCSQVTTVLPPPVTLVLSASPNSISPSGQSTLTWGANAAASCSAIWTSSTATSGAQIVSPNQSTDYSMTCTGQGGSDTQTATVEVAPGGSNPPPPPGTPSSTPGGGNGPGKMFIN